METVAHLKGLCIRCQRNLLENGLWLKDNLAQLKLNKRMRRMLLNEVNHAAWHHLIYQLPQARWQRILKVAKSANGINMSLKLRKCIKKVESRHLCHPSNSQHRKRKNWNLTLWREKCQDLLSPRTARKLNVMSHQIIKSIMRCFSKSLEIPALSLQSVLWSSGGASLVAKKWLVRMLALWAVICNPLLATQSVITRWSLGISVSLKRKELKFKLSCNLSRISQWHKNSMLKTWEIHLHEQNIKKVWIWLVAKRKLVIWDNIWETKNGLSESKKGLRLNKI